LRRPPEAAQYTSDAYSPHNKQQELCARFGITQSMAASATPMTPWPRGFSASLKRELVDWTRFAIHAEARTAVF
jgi:hypothetical protein